MNRVQRWLRDSLVGRPPQQSLLALEAGAAPARRYGVGDFRVVRESELRGARPGQFMDAQWAYATGPNFDGLLQMFITNNWVNTAVSTLATRAAMANLYVCNPDERMRRYSDHPILDLLGPRGRPSPEMNAFLFWEGLFSTLELAGNVYLYWYNTSFAPGPPTEVYQLEPSQVRVVPGRFSPIAKYVYRVQGQEFDLMPWQVTHIRRWCPFNRYYGMSALEALRLENATEFARQKWENMFFDDDVAVPAGILVVPDSVPDTEVDRMEEEFSGKYGKRRRTAVVRAPVGGTVYHPAGLAPKDMDFVEGRGWSRKMTYELLNLPTGLMSEASTEAHARVAERQLAEAIRVRQVRICAEINSDAMWFWPSAKNRVLDFEDLSGRSTDWDRESKKLAAVKPYMLENEVRQQYLNQPPLSPSELEELRRVNGTASNQPGQDRGNSDPGKSNRQVPDLLESGEQPAS